MKLIKFAFWLVSVVTLAYFISDISIGGKSLKQNIDGIVQSDTGQKTKEKLSKWLNEKVKSSVNEVIDKTFETDQAVKMKKEVEKKVEENVEITEEDALKLQQIIEKS